MNFQNGWQICLLHVFRELLRGVSFSPSIKQPTLAKISSVVSIGLSLLASSDQF